MRCRYSWPIWVFAGCSEYGLNGEGSTPPAAKDSAPATDTAVDSAIDTSADSAIDTSGACSTEVLSAEPVATDPECVEPPISHPYALEVLWRRSEFTVEPTSIDCMAAPIVISLTDDDGDGDADTDDIPDVVFVTHNIDRYTYEPVVVRALSGADGAELWSYVGDGIDMAGFPAAADLDGDGFPEVVVTTDTGMLALAHDGTLQWRLEDLGMSTYTTSAAPAISDLDGDGTPEIVCGRDIVSSDGRLLGTGVYGRGNVTGNPGLTSFAVDLDRDGVVEVVAGNTIYEIDGSTRVWQRDEPDGLVAAADFDLDGDGEIVVSGDSDVRLQDHEGTVIWHYASDDWGGGPPVIADFDGDLGPEIGIAAGHSYRVIDTDGVPLWAMPTRDHSSGQTGSIAYDFEGDGVAEVVYADETSLWIFAGPSGAVLAQSDEHSSGTQIEAPVIADVNADGHVDIVVTHQRYGGKSEAGVTVFTDRLNFGAGRGLWNQYAYSYTNINDDGSVPAVATPNWDTYNTFRAGDATPMLQGALADLVVTIDDICCDDGVLLVGVRAGNQGFVDAESATLVLEIEGSSGWEEVERRTLALPAGERSTTELFSLDSTDVLAVRARVEGTVEECDMDNNADDWLEAICP